MSISTPPPPPPPKKRGMGCFGCGCLILALLVLLLVGLVGGACYVAYSKVVGITTTTPTDVPSFNGSDDLYRSATQKLADFDHDVKNHQAATVQLSADEINTLIARNPDVVKNNMRIFVTLSSGEGRVQACLPTDALSQGLITGRYINIDTSFEVHLDVASKSVNVVPHTLKFGDRVFLGPNADPSQASVNQSFMRTFTPAFNQSFNAGIRKNADGAALLDQAKSIEIKNGELVIETQ